MCLCSTLSKEGQPTEELFHLIHFITNLLQILRDTFTGLVGLGDQETMKTRNALLSAEGDLAHIAMALLQHGRFC